jgi:LuxR family maltose regulon positive regulatory protein
MNEGLTDQRFLLPLLPPRHVSRPRLLDRISDSAPAALTVLSAGAGAGKTVLLSEWTRAQDAPVAWLALTPSDNDPRRFWRLFLQAGRATGQVYPASEWAAGGTVELLDDVFGRPAGPGRPVIVLDDAHFLTDPQILDGLDRIVQRWSHRVRLLIAARSDPLLPLHRYRLADQMRELRATDLAMTTDEVSDLLDQHGIRLGDAELRILTERTEGWPAGLRLAAMRMEAAERPGEFVALLAMDQGSIGEYLTEEVLAVLPRPVQTMLVRTSFLDDVTGPLAEAVTGIENCTSLLSGLARTNSFVTPADTARTVFRYHPLFREMLRQLARAQSAETTQAQWARAAHWYREQGDLTNALKWSIRAGDTAGARTLLAHGGLAAAFVGQASLGEAGLLELARDPPPDDASPAELLEFEVCGRAILAIVTDSASADDLAREPGYRASPGGGGPELRATALLADLMLAQKMGNFAAMDTAAERLLADGSLPSLLAVVPGLYSGILVAQAQARLGAGRFPDVDPLLHRALTALPPRGASEVRIEVLSLLALLDVLAGRPRHTDKAFTDAEALLARHPGLARPVLLDIAIARRAHIEADLRAMAAAMLRAQAAGPVYSDRVQAVAVTYLQATLLMAFGELGQARALLCDDPVVNRMAVGLFGVVRDRDLAAIDIELGRPRSALETLRRHQGDPQALLAEVTVARAHLALGDLERATRSVRAVMTTPSPLVNRLLLVEAALCDAEIALHRGDEARTAGLLERALQIAGRDIVLPFVKATPALRAVLARHGTLTTRWPVPVPVSGPPGLPPPRRDPLPDMLTDREQAVLRLMTTSMSTAEIADELCLSVNTIKTHLAAIYRKLAVRRRREAVSRARELELL